MVRGLSVEPATRDSGAGDVTADTAAVVELHLTVGGEHCAQQARLGRRQGQVVDLVTVSLSEALRIACFDD